MQTITDPAVIAMPFCASGDKNTIPTNATGSQLASLEEGFPAITATPISQGGIPPEREDFNGAMNLNSQFYFAFQNGWWPTFNASVSTAIGGYAEGAVLWWFPTTGSFANMAVPVRSMIANNTYNFNTNSAYIGQYWKPLYKDPSAMPIGTVFFHQSSNAADVPGALPLFTGETISNADQLYPEFYSWVASHTDLQISAANYATAISTYGECPFYVINDTNKTIRLPKLGNYIKMANITDGVTQTDAGLPNITGKIDGSSQSVHAQSFGELHEDDITVEGAFEGIFGTQDATTDAAGNSQLRGFKFDASKSNDIYGNSNTVTPAHTTVFPWVFAFNAAIPASTAQAAQFQAALSSKADADLSNCTKPYIVSTSHSGTEWCRIWSDGWCEQGGQVNRGDPNWVSNEIEITFAQPFANTNFFVTATSKETSYTYPVIAVTNYTSSTCKFVAAEGQTAQTPTFCWEAKGYIS